MEPVFDRSVAFWLRAYPRRWRAVRAAEVTAVLADIAGPHAGRLDAAAAFGLVRGGWSTRWREHPPLVTYVRYRVFDRRIPEQYRAWARDDIDGLGYPVRNSFAGTWLVWAMVLLGSLPPVFGLGAVLMMLAVECMLPARLRASQRRKHLALRAGDRIEPGALVKGLAPRRRLAARGTLEVAVLALAVTVGVIIAWGRTQGLLPIAVAAGVGLLLVPLVRHRLGSLIGHRQPQPHRALIARSPQAWASSAAAAVVVVAVPLVLGPARGDLDVSRLLRDVAVPVGVLAALALPGVATAAVVVRRRRADTATLSVSDVRVIALLGRLPAVDENRRGLVPLDAIVAAGGMLAVEANDADARLLGERRPRRRVKARGALAAALVVVAAIAGASMLAVAIGPTTLGWAACASSVEPGAVRCPVLGTVPVGSGRVPLVAALVVAALLGLVGARLVHGRLARLIPLAPKQRHRELVDVPEAAWLAVVLGAAVLVGEATLEAAGVLGVVVSVVLGPLALLVLPGLVVARHLVLYVPDAHRLSASDVFAMTLRGRVPDVDKARRSRASELDGVPLGLAPESAPEGLAGTLGPRGVVQ